MSKLTASTLLLLSLRLTMSAQPAHLTVSLINSTSTTCHLRIPSLAFGFDYLKIGSFDLPVVNGIAKHEFNIASAEFVYLSYHKNESDSAKHFSYQLYVSPGDELELTVDFSAVDNRIVVTGKGSNNNQPLLSAFKPPDIAKLYGDTTPIRIYPLVRKHQVELQKAFRNYVALFKPSAAFIKDKEQDIRYTAAEEYYNFQENNIFQIPKPYLRNKSIWKAFQDSVLIIATPKGSADLISGTNSLGWVESKSKVSSDPVLLPVGVNDGAAMASEKYLRFIQNIVLREKERLWLEQREHPEAFYKEWYGTNVATSKPLFESDVQNLLTEKIINKYFTGRPAEYLYATLFDEALEEQNPTNLVAIFDAFKQKAPNSEYVKWFAPAIDKIRKRQLATVTPEMIIVANNGTRLHSFAEVIALAKNKTVLLDMWGTWCGPCRKELAESSPEIRSHFKGKPLDFFYVANRDLKNEATWKKLIAFFDMKGTHILASDSLTQDIMAKVKGTGFPTYVIVRKDGTYQITKAGFPTRKDVLIKELEEALAN